VIEAAGGRTFFLCTTMRAVNRVAERLREEFAARGLDFPLFVQGEARPHRAARFLPQGRQRVLVGSQSFWEGVDVRGEALSLVIIDKLPFAPPDDPVLAARIEVMEKKGMNGFMHHTLPEAIINLKQGAGRLIRDVDDRGVLMMCDPRVISKPTAAHLAEPAAVQAHAGAGGCDRVLQESRRASVVRRILTWVRRA
jgi:ATP-dependent DNA helicase DinG